MLIFGTGEVVLTGCESSDAAQRALDGVISTIQNLGV
ncbi:hypothetical protein [Halorubrum sp. AJ67]